MAKTVILTVVVTVLAVVGGYLAYEAIAQPAHSLPSTQPSTSSESSSGQASPEPTEEAPGTTAPTEDAIEPQLFTGSGTRVIRDIGLEEGLVVATAEQTSADFPPFFMATLTNTEDGRQRILFCSRQDGDVEAEGANIVIGGTYHLEVESRGAWSITLSQPRAADSEATIPPVKLEGTKSAVRGPYLFDGIRVAKATHNGQLDIIVTVYPMEYEVGSVEVPIMAGGEGVFEGVFFFVGLAWIEIDASGDWTLEIS